MTSVKINEITESWDDRRFRWHERGQATLKPIYYWSYGMLCDPDNMQHPGTKVIGRARLDGYKLELLGHANVIPGNDHMWGTLWRINYNVLSRLDQVEGYPDYYTRITRPVTTDSGDTVEAKIYVMTDSSRQRSLDRGPSNSYVKMIAAGYNHAGIPIDQLKTAWLECRDRLRNLEDGSKY